MANIQAVERNTILAPRVADDRPLNGVRTMECGIPIRCIPIRRLPDRGAGGELDSDIPDHNPPTAVGLVRDDVSGPAALRHALTLPRHARSLGYRHLYTVRPPDDAADPIGYALDIAKGLNASAIVVYDLAAVDNSPARVCEDFDLETVCPPTTWARTYEPPHEPGRNGAVAEAKCP